MFKTIGKNSKAEIIEKKSKFIANIFYIESVQEAEEIIKGINKKYFDARHNCYAFSVYTEEGIVNRFSDDGEPSGTAGAPMLNILKSKDLSNVLIIVTRYFGGVLLGTGGLVRAYSDVTIKALEKIEIIKKDLGLEVKFEVSYSDLQKLKYYFEKKNINIVGNEFNENVRVLIEITKEKLDELIENKLNLNFEIINYKVIKEKFINLTI